MIFKQLQIHQTKGLFTLGCSVLSIWLILYYSEYSSQSTPNIHLQKKFFPNFQSWSSIRIDTKGYPSVKIFKTAQEQWMVDIDQDSEVRPLNPLLRERLKRETASLSFIESRPLHNQKTIEAWFFINNKDF